MHISGTRPEFLFISTFTPRECGIATFTHDLINALKPLVEDEFDITVCALDSVSKVKQYNAPVTLVMDSLNLDSCIAGAAAINQNTRIKMICIEHEFGLYGGEMGNYVLGFLSLLNKPAIVRFHTVLPHPDETRLKLVQNIGLLAEKIIVMTKQSAIILTEQYMIKPEKLMIIPHGTHYIEPQDPVVLKATHQLENRQVLTTFGLLSPNKGIETGIRAMAKIVQQFPDAIYLILGRTHPNLVATEGETYRESLEALIAENGLTNNVRMVNEFIPTSELLSYLALTDIYLFTSRDRDQAISGTFMYAMSAGCAIISNAFVLANEMLDEQTGVIIDSGNDEALALNAVHLLQDENARKKMGHNAYLKTRNTLWKNVAQKHLALFNQSIQKSLAIVG